MAPEPLHLVTSLCDALDAARRVRTDDELKHALDAAAAVIAEATGFAAVAVHLHRPAWDDFVVAAAHGVSAAGAVLVGEERTWRDWAPLLTPRHGRRGTHHVLVEGTEHERDGAWRRGDELLVALRRTDGAIAGIVSVDDPADGRRPCDDDLDRLVALTSVAALAVQHHQDARASAERGLALERLLGVSARIAEQHSGNAILDEVCAGIRDALGFELVAVLLADDRGRLRPAAVAGWAPDDPRLSSALTLSRLAPILQTPFERHGCYLLDADEAQALTGLTSMPYESRRNGRGPLAWERHWLVVPLHGPRGQVRGVIWVDDPSDRRLPGRDRLQTLRLFADQAMAALRATGEIQVVGGRAAAPDPLTGLADRGTFLERLRHAVQRTKRTPEHLAVLFVDVDAFKTINDRLGHAAGDALLQVVAARIDEMVRPGDTVARFGGDEFVVLCEDVGGAAAAVEVAERLRASLAEPVPLSEGVASVTASIGVALPDRADRSAEAILQAADRAMYEVKAAGRDGTRLAPPGSGWPLS